MTSVRLRHLAEINPATPAFDRLSDADEVTFLPLEAVWPGSRLDSTRRRTKASVATGYTRFQDGDVLVPKITPTFEADRSILVGGLHKGVGAGTTELHVIRSGPTIDPRFLLYVLKTHRFLKLGEAEMYGVAGQKRVPDSFLRDLPVRLPSLEKQRRIADFLDAETARIDRILTIRGRQEAVLHERMRVLIEHLISGSSTGRRTRLKRLLRARPRYGVLVPRFMDEGVKFIRVNDLLDLDARANQLLRIPEELSAQYPTTIVREGDVLVSVVGTLGRVAVASSRVKGANVNRAIAILRPLPEIDQQLLAAWIEGTEFERQALVATGTDSAQRTLGMEDVANFSLIWPTDGREQRSVARSVAKVREDFLAMIAKLRGQINLLTERRRALISAAVTGEIEVSTQTCWARDDARTTDDPLGDHANVSQGR